MRKQTQSKHRNRETSCCLVRHVTFDKLHIFIYCKNVANNCTHTQCTHTHRDMCMLHKRVQRKKESVTAKQCHYISSCKRRNSNNNGNKTIAKTDMRQPWTPLPLAPSPSSTE